MKRNYFLSFLLLPSFFAVAQSIIPDQLLKSQNSLRTLSGTYSGLFVEGIPHPKGTVITEHYLNEYWKRCINPFERF